ncbi:MAG: hypothetical protein K6A62_01045, partial [Bacteroidales bacterium]|nr:hypothetical protein [Bacteroidales bacterium]
RCTENRHSTQNFCTPPHGFYRFPLFWPTGIHFYCTSGRFCGHLSDDGVRQPVGRMCGGPRPFACAVGACRAGALQKAGGSFVTGGPTKRPARDEAADAAWGWQAREYRRMTNVEAKRFAFPEINPIFAERMTQLRAYHHHHRI